MIKTIKGAGTLREINKTSEIIKQPISIGVQLMSIKIPINTPDTKPLATAFIPRSARCAHGKVFNFPQNG